MIVSKALTDEEFEAEAIALADSWRPNGSTVPMSILFGGDVWERYGPDGEVLEALMLTVVTSSLHDDGFHLGVTQVAFTPQQAQDIALMLLDFAGAQFLTADEAAVAMLTARGIIDGQEEE